MMKTLRSVILVSAKLVDTMRILKPSLGYRLQADDMNSNAGGPDGGSPACIPGLRLPRAFHLQFRTTTKKAFKDDSSAGFVLA